MADSKKLSKAQFEKYMSGRKVKVTAEDFSKIDGDKIDTIANLATFDVYNGKDCRDSNDKAFQNEAEYKYYMVCACGVAARAAMGR